MSRVSLQSEDKRVLKSSSVSGPVTSSTSRMTSSWRHGLSQWLQRSRASAAASSAAVSSNNNVDGGAGGTRRGSGGAKRAVGAGNNSSGAGSGGVSSAPISISIVSNHGHVRTLAPNSFGKVATAATTTTTGSGGDAETGNKTHSSVTSTTDQCSKRIQFYSLILTAKIRKILN